MDNSQVYRVITNLYGPKGLEEKLNEAASVGYRIKAVIPGEPTTTEQEGEAALLIMERDDNIADALNYEAYANEREKEHLASSAYGSDEVTN